MRRSDAILLVLRSSSGKPDGDCPEGGGEPSCGGLTDAGAWGGVVGGGATTAGVVITNDEAGCGDVGGGEALSNLGLCEAEILAKRV